MTHAAALASPLGPFWVATTETGGVVRAGFGTRAEATEPFDELAHADWTSAAPAEAVRQLDAYFAGTRRTFTVELAPAGTPFQQEVWRALGAIDFGRTLSYGELAKRVGRPRGAQAVGRANGQNPVAVVVPCHRVVGADGALVGYAGGLDRKAALLAHEGAAVGPNAPSLFDERHRHRAKSATASASSARSPP